ncbi:MAG TPA: type VI secretion system baseplate subunit TssG [Pyrinomonadaceae bacterium]|jgi:type VI secretion system protein ImpH|nr:type VI secretion system baseplate subunit TssG [Pyrinomonadaceae bacterium]
MASEGRRNAAPLTGVLFDESYRFEFFQAVRLLERIFKERQPVGRIGSAPADEVVRFRTRQSLDFPASQIYEMQRGTRAAVAAAAGDDGDEASPVEPQPQMHVAFMGLTGPMGVLPRHYTELIAERVRAKDHALWEFLDIFNHRLLSLFYRAWEKYRFTVAYERGDRDRFTEYLFDIVGLGTRGLQDRLRMRDEGLLFYGGLIAQRPHSASAMAAILADRFGVPARVEQFSGQWLKIEPDSVTRLGAANSELGVSTIVGARVWDEQSKFRLRFGPLALQQFLNLIPSGGNFQPATRLTRFLAGAEFDFDVQLTLRAAEVPPTVLTTRAKRRPMLGWTTWLKTQEFTEDDSQVVLSVNN